MDRERAPGERCGRSDGIRRGTDDVEEILHGGIVPGGRRRRLRRVSSPLYGAKVAADTVLAPAKGTAVKVLT
jgi:hypothetical protein